MNLKELRTKLNLTQAALAKELGVTSYTISAIEGGRLKLSDKLSAKINEVYGGAEVAAIAEAEKAFETEAKAAVAEMEAFAAEVGKAVAAEEKAEKKKARAAKKKAEAEEKAIVDTVTAVVAEVEKAVAAEEKAEKKKARAAKKKAEAEAEQIVDTVSTFIAEVVEPEAEKKKIRTCTRCLLLLWFVKLISIFQAFWLIKGNFNDSLYFFKGSDGGLITKEYKSK